MGGECLFAELEIILDVGEIFDLVDLQFGVGDLVLHDFELEGHIGEVKEDVMRVYLHFEDVVAELDFHHHLQFRLAIIQAEQPLVMRLLLFFGPPHKLVQFEYLVVGAHLHLHFSDVWVFGAIVPGGADGVDLFHSHYLKGSFLYFLAPCPHDLHDVQLLFAIAIGQLPRHPVHQHHWAQQLNQIEGLVGQAIVHIRPHDQHFVLRGDGQFGTGRKNIIQVDPAVLAERLALSIALMQFD